MEISFFEEYPNTKNLEKLKLINFSTKLYLADYSIESYKVYKKQLQKEHKNLKEVIWWPILNFSEGYWLSPFSKRRALLRLFHVLLKERIPIMWDAEVPRKRSLFLTQFFKHFKNRALIRKFFLKYKGQIYTAENLLENSFLEYLCLNFNPKNYDNIKIKMMYSSMHLLLNKDPEFMKKEIKKFKDLFGDKIYIGLGVLATGVIGNEKTMTPKLLERDLKICKELDIKEIIIFRLGGLNKEYLKIIKKYI